MPIAENGGLGRDLDVETGCPAATGADRSPLAKGRVSGRAARAVVSRIDEPSEAMGIRRAVC